MPQAAADPVADLLMKAPPPVRADAWDAFHAAKNADEFATAIKAMPIADSVKADLWDLKQKESAAPATTDAMNFAIVNGKRVDLTDLSPDVADAFREHATQGDALLDNIKNIAGKVTDSLPYVGGAVGGLLGMPAGPAGSIALAALGGAAGEGAKTVAHRIGQAVSTGDVTTPIDTTATAGNMAKQAAVQGGSQAIGEGLGAGMKAGAPWLMQTALKPALSTLKEYGTTAPKLVQTLLDEGINVTQGGLLKLQQLFDATNQEIRDAVSNATGTIKKDAVAARVLPTAAKIAQQTNPTSDLKAVGATVKEFRNHPIFKGDLTVPEAQAMKVGTYQQIGKKYGEVSSASIETQKALARGLKEEIAAEVPGIGKLNEKDSELMAALDAVGRRVALSGNKDPVGFAWVAAHPTAFIAALFDRNPVVKSMVARGAYQSAGSVAKVAPQLIRAAVAALATASPDAQPPQD